MSKRLSGTMNLDMIKEAIQGGVAPFEGKKGKYIPITVWVNDELDQFGNIASLSVYNKETKKSTYLGNLKEFDAEAIGGSAPAASTPDLPF